MAALATFAALSSCSESATDPSTSTSTSTSTSPSVALCADGVDLNAPSTPVPDNPSSPTRSLNDRCDLPTPAAISGFVPANVVMTEVDCGDDVSVWIAAERGVLLISSSVDIGVVVGELEARGVVRTAEPRPVGSTDSVFLLPIDNVIDAAFITNTIPTLQGVGYRVDLNYLEPVLPQNGFRTDDDPLPSAAPIAEPGIETNAGSGKRILVIDSPLAGIVVPGSPYPNAASPLVVRPPVNVSPDGVDIDSEDNGFTDEDHSHGLFVASLIKRLAPGAEVTLQGLDVFHAEQARPSPMWFSDAALIAALDSALAAADDPATDNVEGFDAVNLSLGGAGCSTHANRLALANHLGSLVMSGSIGALVSAAGNDGSPALHFPAAFASVDWWDEATRMIDDASGNDAATDFAQFSSPMTNALISVGSSIGAVADCFSNHGDWVTAWAPGKQQVSRYQTPAADVWASWSGTSFAAARVTAAKATNATIDGTVKDVPSTGSCS